MFSLTDMLCDALVYFPNLVRIQNPRHPKISLKKFNSGTSPATDGLPGLYDLLVTAGHENPVIGNQDGSYLTMKSNQGLVFGAATILSGFSGIFCDQGYWQRVRSTSTGCHLCRKLLT